jgi:hypothetical protein
MRALAVIKAVSKEKLKRAVWGKIDIDEADFRKLMVVLITIVVAAVAVNLVWGLGTYVLVQVNSSVDGAIRSLISPSVVGMSSTVFTLYIIIAVVSAVAAMIAVFMKLGKAPEATTT